MKNKATILDFTQDGITIKAALIHLPERKVYVCKVVLKHPTPRISRTIYIDEFLYPDYIDVIKDQIVSEMQFTLETLLTK